jgi:hypothetical protein
MARREIVGSIEVPHGATRSLDAGNAPKWSGATPLRCHGNRGGRSRPRQGRRKQKKACGAAVSRENPEGAVKRVRITHYTFCFSSFFTP